ncbi:ABC transporter ATP-binding protein [Glutamicibacter arilaitensis]|uniref:ABC transporter ATP-binding protein n=1 Tax=Glutamicibacter arilaitensis TaxID=256701 RepID=UPI003A952AEE
MSSYRSQNGTIPAPLELRDIAIQLGDGSKRILVRSASGVVSGGESVGILGKSGSGKTSLLSVLGLMSRPVSGELLLSGKPTSRLNDAELARRRNQDIGFVFQNYSLISHLSVFENVALPCSYGKPMSKKQTMEAVAEQLQAVGLAGFEKRRPRSLSGGEQQRVAIARALVRSPQIVLADEPTGALDSATGLQVLEHLYSATRRAGACLVVVTHDEDIAQAMDQTWTLCDSELRHEAKGSR